ncbi:MAG: FAD-dependent oxidoreductase [Myxococcales bacterium]|nr:FAD-dependent oxidoreductase [Myxococcales bacterium]
MPAQAPSSRTVIIGGGLAGIAAALHAQRPHVLVERTRSLGGLARTEERDGFFFDHTGHWLHLRDAYIRELVTSKMGNDLVEVERRAQIFSHGVLTQYPFQGNLFGLPPDVVHECLVGIVNAHMGRDAAGEPRNFEQYVEHHFGVGIAKHFMVPYNRKLWGVEPSEITSAWCSRFVPKPNLEQVIAGAVGAGSAQLGYNVRFMYPKHGGIGAMSRAISADIDPDHTRLGLAVDQIDPRARTVRAGDESWRYHAVISSVPLPKLVEMIVGAPDEVREAASKLRATAVRYLNVATNKPARADYHWVYVPEEKYPFYRVGVFSNAMPSMAPPGCSSLYVELSDRSPIDDREALKRDAIRALVEIKAINSSEDVVFADLRRIDPAYVIFDEAYESALEVIHPYLESQRIYSTGRYGAWIYNAMEDSLLAGKAAIETVESLPADENAA